MDIRVSPRQCNGRSLPLAVGQFLLWSTRGTTPQQRLFQDTDVPLRHCMWGTERGQLQGAYSLWPKAEYRVPADAVKGERPYTEEVNLRLGGY